MKIKNIFLIMSGSIFFIIQAFITWTPDLFNYEIHFYNIDLDYVRLAVEPVHIKLIEFVHYINEDFQYFLGVYAALTLILFLFFLKKTTPSPAFVLSIFFIVPYFLNIIQIRNFLAISVFLVAVLYYEKRKIIFWAFYILSVLCHFSMLILLPFFLVRKFSFFNKLSKSNIAIIIGMLILLAVPKSIAEPLVTAINPKYSDYLEATSTYLGTIALFIPFFIINNFILWHYYNKFYLWESRVNESYKKYLPIFIQLVQYANYLILAQYFIRDFSRITMNLSLLSYIYLSVIFFYRRETKQDKLRVFLMKFMLYLWGGVSFYLIFLSLNEGEYFDVIEKTFNSNLIFR
ncbi:EpsG family protein [Riemerella anatipestifer]|nr:EpsG family protein [Riemerella anatipestifer]MDR7782636.1 EpsG family protein [Riemerella anatipestifer]